MKQKTSYNHNHPEVLPGEVFITNCHPRDVTSVGWATKRVGSVAYDRLGGIVKELLPVFAQRWEIPDDILSSLDSR
ncbi:hypothetical protein LCGC14_1174860 [marine sediment metagenome]|uniref:Uncharacterized protein n=1 Tax=marine sediment metagenome TaxID=412755 RepID=A0A0F9LNT5_9ZZZZ